MYKELSKPTIISGENYGVKTTVEFDHSDISLDEVFDAFETIVTGMGFHKDSWKRWILERADEYREDEPEFDGAGFSIEDREPHSHFVSNEEADEDAFTDHLLGADLDFIASVKQDEQRYEDGKSKFNGVSQHILDFVEKQGTATFFDMNEVYRKFTAGSNSLSHIIKALMIPYKNRPTRRYLKKVKHGVYAVDYATQYNWVVNDNYND